VRDARPGAGGPSPAETQQGQDAAQAQQGSALLDRLGRHDVRHTVVILVQNLENCHATIEISRVDRSPPLVGIRVAPDLIAAVQVAERVSGERDPVSTGCAAHDVCTGTICACRRSECTGQGPSAAHCIVLVAEHHNRNRLPVWCCRRLRTRPGRRAALSWHDPRCPLRVHPQSATSWDDRVPRRFGTAVRGNRALPPRCEPAVRSFAKHDDVSDYGG